MLLLLLLLLLLLPVFLVLASYCLLGDDGEWKGMGGGQRGGRGREALEQPGNQAACIIRTCSLGNWAWGPDEGPGTLWTLRDAGRLLWYHTNFLKREQSRVAYPHARRKECWSGTSPESKDKIQDIEPLFHLHAASRRTWRQYNPMALGEGTSHTLIYILIREHLRAIAARRQAIIFLPRPSS